jgi:Tfp pilus assembly protein PilP
MSKMKRKRPKKRISPCLLIPLWILLFPWGAAGSQDLLYKPPREKKVLPKAVEGQSGAKAPSQASPVRESYNFESMTDPFKSFIAEQEAVEEKKKRKPRTYLETLDLSQLDLVATVIEPRGSWAMVRDAKGLGHVIRVGTPIGTNEGVVARIEEGEVVIKEKHTDFRGQEVIKEVTKKLPSPQLGQGEEGKD